MEKFDILFVGISSVETDASQHKLYFLASALARRGLRVSVMVPSHPENIALLERLGGPVERLLFAPCGAGREPWVKLQLCRRREWACVYIVGLGLRSLVFRRFLRGRPRIIQDLDELPSLIGTLGPARRWYLKVVEEFAWRRSDGFVCASQFLLDQSRQRRPDLGGEILRLPVAVAPDELTVKPGVVDQLRRLHRGRSVLLYIGSMHRFYQVEELIELARIFREEHSSVFIRVLGDGPDRAYFQSQAAAAGVQPWIAFEGHVVREDLASHMQAADVLLFPFHHTAFNLSRCPTKAFHYAAANRPVVTNRFGEVEALLGESAFYYHEANVRDMARACRNALSARTGFDNGIDRDALTWDRRADIFLRWLDDSGWAKAACEPQPRYA